MKPINQITTKEQQEHLANGGKMIYFVMPSGFKSITSYKNDIQEATESLIRIVSPIQPDTEYYLQEDFKIGYWNEETHQMAFDYRTGKCKELRDIPEGLFIKMVHTAVEQLNKLDITPNKKGDYRWEKYRSPLDWYDKVSMTEYQARHKFKFDVEIKKVQDLTVSDFKLLGITEDEAIMCNGWRPSYNDPDSGGVFEWGTAFESKHNNLHPNQPYESNPYIIVARVK